jgi:hypothetical protein
LFVCGLTVGRLRAGLSACFSELRKLTLSRTRNGFAQGLLPFGKPPHRFRLRFARAWSGAARAGTGQRRQERGWRAVRLATTGENRPKSGTLRAATGVKRQRGTAADTAGNQKMGWAAYTSPNERDIDLDLRMQPGYDYSYFFIASFIDDHLHHHARFLL